MYIQKSVLDETKDRIKIMFGSNDVYIQYKIKYYTEHYDFLNKLKTNDHKLCATSYIRRVTRKGLKAVDVELVEKLFLIYSQTPTISARENLLQKIEDVKTELKQKANIQTLQASKRIIKLKELKDIEDITAELKLKADPETLKACIKIIKLKASKELDDITNELGLKDNKDITNGLKQKANIDISQASKTIVKLKALKDKIS